MAEDQIPALESQLLDLIPTVGSIGNLTLKRQLSDKGWSEEKYSAVRQRLIDRGVLAVGRGRGGSVKRAEPGVMPVARKSIEAVDPDAPLPSGADLLELKLESGGRLLAIVQGGRPTASDIASLHSLLLAHYSDPDANAGLVSGVPSDEALEDPFDERSALQDPGDEESDEGDPQDESGNDEKLVLMPGRRANRDEHIEALVGRIIQSINVRKNNSRVRAVIIARYGLGDEDEKTLDAIGKGYDVTREYVRQIEAKALTRLAADSGLRELARDALAGWIKQVVAASSDTGALLTGEQIETLHDDRTVIDGWIKLALDVAFPVSGAGKLKNQLIALADLALQRYAPFGVDCWVSDAGRVSAIFPNVEEWLEALEGGSHALPLPADTFAALLAVDVADVMAVVSAHPRFSMYAGYVFHGAATTVRKRAVRAHILASHLSPDAAPLSQLTLWKAYRQRFQDIDACSSNDIRLALSEDKRGAPHLFIVDNRNSLYALGDAATVHGLDLSPRFPDPEPDQLTGAIGQLVDELRHGPATAESLAERLDINPEGAISQLGQRPDFVSVTPRYYDLAEQAPRMASLRWENQDLVEKDALELIGCRQAGEDPQSVYPGWTPAYELALCARAQDNGWRCLPRLLWACRPDRWPLAEHEKAHWVERKTLEGQAPATVSMPDGNRLPDPERLLRFLLVIRQQGALSMALANRMTRPRGPLEQVNGVLIAILTRVGALQPDADTYWAKHHAGQEAERWYSMLADEYMQNGRLDWAGGVCLSMLQDAVAGPGHGWAAGDEWAQRIRNFAAGRGVDFETLENAATDPVESDEALGAPGEEDETNVGADLLSDADLAQGDDPPSPAEPDAEELTRDAEELTQLASRITLDETPAVIREALETPAPVIDSVAVLVAKAKSGDAEAQYGLARQLLDGIGAAPNLQAAIYWLQRAADARHVPACVRLGRMLLKGEAGDGSREDRQKGLIYLNAGTKVGNATACYLVGLAYRDGKLTRKNPNTALRLLKRAARAGHGNAAYELALMLRGRMDGWVPDTVNLLRLAAEKGVRPAAELLGQIEVVR